MVSKETRAERDKQHRQAVEAEKERLRRSMAKGEHVYGEAWYREHTRNGNYVEADAIGELMDEINQHNAKVAPRGPAPFPGGAVEEHLRAERRREFEERQERDAERARREVEEYARNHPAPNPDAALEQPLTSASVNPGAENTTEQEVYEREMEAWEEKRRQAVKEGYAYALTPPSRPRRKRRRSA